MKNLHERLCTWVQVHHLYQPKGSGLLEAYRTHHIAHCRFCQNEIDAIESVGSSVRGLNFEVTNAPDDASWARLSSVLPPRQALLPNSDQEFATSGRLSFARIATVSVLSCVGISFAAVIIKSNVTQARIESPKVVSEPIDKGPRQNVSPDALAYTRNQAKSVATLETSQNDPFAKSNDDSPGQPVTVPLPIHHDPKTDPAQTSKKPLIVASIDSHDAGERSNQGMMEMTQPSPAVQPFLAPRMAVRTTASKVNVDSMLESTQGHQNSDLSTTQASYLPSAAMELTESQNRLRSLLQ